jgi:hypothetical protein
MIVIAYIGHQQHGLEEPLSKTAKKQFLQPTGSECKTPAAPGLEELFTAVLERFLQPIHALHMYCKS